MDGPPFCLAFVMVKESFVVPAIFFYLESAANNHLVSASDRLKFVNGHIDDFSSTN
jgi:hypothetical protein